MHPCDIYSCKIGINPTKMGTIPVINAGHKYQGNKTQNMFGRTLGIIHFSKINGIIIEPLLVIIYLIMLYRETNNTLFEFNNKLV